MAPGKENNPGVEGVIIATLMLGLPAMLKSRASLPDALTNPIFGNRLLLRVTFTSTTVALSCVNNTVPNGPLPLLALVLKL